MLSFLFPKKELSAQYKTIYDFKVEALHGGTIDFSEYTHQIVEYAFYIGEKLGASVKLAHIVEQPFYYGDIEYPSIGPYTEELGKGADKIMRALVDKYKKNYTACEGKVIRGVSILELIVYRIRADGCRIRSSTKAGEVIFPASLVWLVLRAKCRSHALAECCPMCLCRQGLVWPCKV